MTALAWTLAACSITCLAVWGALRLDEKLTARRVRREWTVCEYSRSRIEAMREAER